MPTNRQLISFPSMKRARAALMLNTDSQMVRLRSLLISVAISSAFAQYSPLLNITTDFGTNPTNVKMSIYTPSQLAVPTPLIVALHDCASSAVNYFRGTSLAPLADQHGFIVIYPNAPATGACWDVHTNATLTHNGGGDSLGIASVVRYAVANLGVDASQVFATGTASGAMMASVLLGAYPDLFKAGSLYNGVPFGCFAGTSAWNTQCATGQLIQTPQQWGDRVRNAYSGFTGTRPKVQFWHGSLDTSLYPQNFWEEIKQWTNVFGVSQTPVSNTSNDPQAQYSRASFGPNVQAILAQGIEYGVPENEPDTLSWFGLSSLTPAPSPTSTTYTAPSSSPTAVGASHWHQCGGIGYTGPTVCQAPFSCQVLNAYFSECL